MKSKADNSIIYSADNTEDWPEIEKELSEMEFDVPPISEDRLIQLHSLVLEKAGLKKKKKSPRRAVYMRLCACAAVALFAVLGVFALPGQLRLFGAESNEPDSKNAAAEVCNDTASLYDGIYSADDAVGTGADGEMPTVFANTSLYYSVSENSAGSNVFFADNDSVTLALQNAVAGSNSMILTVDADTDVENLFTDEISVGGITVSAVNPDTGAEYTEKIPSGNIQFSRMSDSALRIFIKSNISPEFLTGSCPVQIFVYDIFGGVDYDSGTSREDNKLAASAQGSWNLSFTLDESTLMQTYRINRELQLDGDLRVQLDFAEISPFSCFIYGVCSDESKASLEKYLNEEICLALSDGSRICPDAVFSDFPFSNSFKISLVFSDALSDDISAVYIGEQRFDL